MQDVQVSQLHAPPPALCAVTALRQESPEQAASVDQGTIGLCERASAVTLF